MCTPHQASLTYLQCKHCILKDTLLTVSIKGMQYYEKLDLLVMKKKKNQGWKRKMIDIMQLRVSIGNKRKKHVRYLGIESFQLKTLNKFLALHD